MTEVQREEVKQGRIAMLSRLTSQEQTHFTANATATATATASTSGIASTDVAAFHGAFLNLSTSDQAIVMNKLAASPNEVIHIG